MTVNAWSHSVLDSFETCEYRHFLTKVTKDPALKVVEPQSKEMAWGNRVHKAMEERVGSKVPLPAEMVQWEPKAMAIDAARRAGAHVEVEQKMAIDVNYKQVTYFHKINGTNAVWVRGAADVVIERRSRAKVLDWKTGKPKVNSDQMKLMAGMQFVLKPYLEEIETAFIWLAFPNTPPDTQTFARDDLAGIWQDFIPRVQRLNHAIDTGRFVKKPSGLCKNWCPVPKGTGPGCCEHRG